MINLNTKKIFYLFLTFIPLIQKAETDENLSGVIQAAETFGPRRLAQYMLAAWIMDNKAINLAIESKNIIIQKNLAGEETTKEPAKSKPFIPNPNQKLPSETNKIIEKVQRNTLREEFKKENIENPKSKYYFDQIKKELNSNLDSKIISLFKKNQQSKLMIYIFEMLYNPDKNSKKQKNLSNDYFEALGSLILYHWEKNKQFYKFIGINDYHTAFNTIGTDNKPIFKKDITLKDLFNIKDPSEMLIKNYDISNFFTIITFQDNDILLGKLMPFVKMLTLSSNQKYSSSQDPDQDTYYLFAQSTINLLLKAFDRPTINATGLQKFMHKYLPEKETMKKIATGTALTGGILGAKYLLKEYFK